MRYNIDDLPRALDRGYETVYLPKHPSAKSNGYVYVHRVVMENYLDRQLKPFETVHHKDGCRNNNKVSNLLLTTNSGHAHMHRGAVKPRRCLSCGVVFNPPVNRVAYCSHKCAAIGQERAKWPSDGELRRLLQKIPAEHLARRLGVSGSAVAHRCRRRGIIKPSRGFWSGARTP